MTMAVRNSDRQMITALGGLCCRPMRRAQQGQHHHDPHEGGGHDHDRRRQRQHGDQRRRSASAVRSSPAAGEIDIQSLACSGRTRGDGGTGRTGCAAPAACAASASEGRNSAATAMKATPENFAIAAQGRFCCLRRKICDHIAPWGAVTITCSSPSQRTMKSRWFLPSIAVSTIASRACAAADTRKAEPLHRESRHADKRKHQCERAEITNGFGHIHE